MHHPPIPLNEAQRLQALGELSLLDTLPDARFDRITRLATYAFGVPIALVSLLDRSRQWFKSNHGLEACQTSREISFCAHAILTDEPLVIPDTWKDARFADNPLVTDEPHIRFYAGHPIHSPSGLRVGTLCLIDSEPRHFSEEDRNALQDLASIVDQELGLLQRATIDELTGLYNRRGFFEIGNSILALCRRRGESATLIGIDLDGFKSVNDTYGHERGDQVLRIFGNLLRSHFRTSDVIARVGGDEFAVLCAGADSSGILQSLEVFQQEFRASDCGAANVGLAWSAGAAEFNPQSTDALTDLMKRADVKMYQAKLERKGAWRA